MPGAGPEPGEERLPAPQRGRLTELRAAGAGRLYAEPHCGRSVIRSLTRYLEGEDAVQIDHALYQLLQGAGFIAHCGLVPPDGGFRIVYREPTDVIEEYLGARHREGGPPTRVYRDGMTDLEVRGQVTTLALRHRDAAARAKAARQRERDIALVAALAERHGLTVLRGECALARRPPSGGEALSLFPDAGAAGQASDR